MSSMIDLLTGQGNGQPGMPTTQAPPGFQRPGGPPPPMQGPGGVKMAPPGSMQPGPQVPQPPPQQPQPPMGAQGELDPATLSMLLQMLTGGEQMPQMPGGPMPGGPMAMGGMGPQGPQGMPMGAY